MLGVADEGSRMEILRQCQKYRFGFNVEFTQLTPCDPLFLQVRRVGRTKGCPEQCPLSDFVDDNRDYGAEGSLERAS